MKNLITIVSLAATIALANAEFPKASYQPVVDISEIHPYAKLDAWRAYQKERRTRFTERTDQAKANRVKEAKPAPLTAESLFAAKIAERHGK
jgi:hypothetical protein